MVALWLNYPDLFFGRERGTLRYARQGLIKWLKENVERKTSSQIPSSGVEVCCKCRLSFLNKYLG